MSSQRCHDIARIIKKWNLILVEDDLYGFLSSEESCPLSSIVPEQSINISGTSKAFYAGLRIGFIASPERFCNRIAQAVVDTVWMAPPLNAEIVCRCISSGVAKEIINLKRAEIKKRAELMLEQLQGYTFEYAKDSMFVWLKLPEFWSSSSFEKEAGRYGINVFSSDKFSVGGIIPPNYVRISLTGVEDFTKLIRGFEILNKLLKYEIGYPSGIL
jgi:DNA-binding transcriptional MocR family regulator